MSYFTLSPAIWFVTCTDYNFFFQISYLTKLIWFIHMFLRKKHEKYTYEDIFSISDKSPPLKLFTKWHTPQDDRRLLVRVCVETVACDPLRALCFKGLQLPNNKILENNVGNVFLKRHIKKGIFFSFILCIFCCTIRIWNPFFAVEPINIFILKLNILNDIIIANY